MAIEPPVRRTTAIPVALVDPATGEPIPGALPITAPSVDAWSVASKNANTSSQTIAAANADRKGCIITNNANGILYLRMTGDGAAATTNSGGYNIAVAPGSTWTMDAPIYTGEITGIWPSGGATGTANVSEA